jgi:response regulator of citrate/malate metabolism
MRRQYQLLEATEKLSYMKLKLILLHVYLAKLEGSKYLVTTEKTNKEDKELLTKGFEDVAKRNGVKGHRKRK